MTDDLEEDKPIEYLGKPLASYTLWELGAIKTNFDNAMLKREQASSHIKFDAINNKKAMVFPPPNPQFLKLKSAVEEEIRKKQNA